MNFRFAYLHSIAERVLLGTLIALLSIPSYAENASNSSRLEPTGLLTIQEAAALALERSPALDAFTFDVRAAEARRLQASFRPNPELEIETEEIRWNSPSGGGASGFSDAEITAGISQLFELGSKRKKRTQAGALDIELASWDYKTARADVLSMVVQNFVAVLIAQESASLAQETVDMAESVRETIAARVKAGQVSPLELNRAEIALSISKIDNERSSRELKSARAQLVSTWGSNNSSFERATGDLNTVRPIPTLADLKLRTSANPDVARWMTEIAFRESVVEIERSIRIPDLTVTTGYRVAGISEAKDESAVMAFSLPLPLFNRNRGSIQEAEHMVSRAIGMGEATKVDVFSQVTDAYYDVSAAYLEIQSLNRNVLPRAIETFEAIREAYRQGKFSYLDVLEAQRTLFDVRVQHLEALGNYHGGIATIDRLIGESLFNEYDFTAVAPEEK